MTKHLKYSFYTTLLIFSLLNTASAGVYLGVSPVQLDIQSSASAKPLQVEIRLGYAFSKHHIEAIHMLALRDGTLNKLTIQVPSVQSILYRYVSPATGKIDMFYILGASQIKVTSNYPNVAESMQQFQGISYGLGFEEAFQSYPNLKLKFDWLQLYRGKQLKINAISLGVRYEF